MYMNKSVKEIAKLIDACPSLIKTNGFCDTAKLMGLFNMNPLEDNCRSGIFILTAERENGKSYSSNKLGTDVWKKFGFKQKICFVKETDIELQKMIRKFRASYNGFLDVNGEVIVKNEYDNDGKVIRSDEVGCFCSISLEEQYKSPPVNLTEKQVRGSFIDYRLMFYDEFNKSKQSIQNYYYHFINLVSTVGRINKPFVILLVGNRVSASNDIYTAYDFDANRKNLGETFAMEITDEKTGEFLGVWVDLGKNCFNGLVSRNSLAHKLAQFEETTDNLFNQGGHAFNLGANVINKRNIINKQKDSIKYLQIGEYKFEFGIFSNPDRLINKNEVNYYFQKIKFAPEGAKVTALNVLAYMRQAVLKDTDDVINLANKIAQLNSKQCLYFDSFDTKMLVEEWIIRKTNIGKK